MNSKKLDITLSPGKITKTDSFTEIHLNLSVANHTGHDLSFQNGPALFQNGPGSIDVIYKDFEIFHDNEKIHLSWMYGGTPSGKRIVKYSNIENGSSYNYDISMFIIKDPYGVPNDSFRQLDLHPLSGVIRNDSNYAIIFRFVIKYNNDLYEIKSSPFKFNAVGYV
jgi:hypothetical protein